MPSRQVDEHAATGRDPYDKVLTPSRRFGFELKNRQVPSVRTDTRWQIVPVRNLETFSVDIP